MTKAVISVLLVAVLFLFYVRIAPSRPEVWHVDPLTVEKPRKRNWFLMRDGARTEPLVFKLPAAELAAAFDRVALASPETERLAGSPEDLFVTYVSRTRMLKYPDYISVRFQDVGEGSSSIVMFSRARFGYSDRGVNRRRALKWLKRLEETLQTARAD